MTALEALKAARELIRDPEHWTQGASARDHNGCSVQVSDRDACSWCARGAVLRITEFTTLDVLWPLYDQLPDEERSLVDFNDTRTHAEVLALFDRAIERAS